MRMRYVPTKDSPLYKRCIFDEVRRGNPGLFHTMEQQAAIYYAPDSQALQWKGNRIPQDPTVGDVYADNTGRQYMYDGTGWLEYRPRVGASQWDYVGDLRRRTTPTYDEFSDPWSLTVTAPASASVIDYFRKLRRNG